MEFLTKFVDRRRESKERGAGLVEYALIVSLISVVSIGGVTAAGSSVNEVFSDLAGDLYASSCGRLNQELSEGRAERREYIDNGVWYGSANRDTRDIWWAKRNQVDSGIAAGGC